MTVSKTIDLSTVIGIFPLCNTGAVLVHKIDYGEEKVLSSINGEIPEWCSLTEEYDDTTGEQELGFYPWLSFCAISSGGEILRRQ